MTDIEFDQIREGQTVRLHLGDPGMQITATARTNAYTLGGADWRFDVEDWLTLKGFAVTRVELLSEPAPKWEQDQLAEATFARAYGGRTGGMLARQPDGWWTVASGDRVPDDEVTIGRLMVAVPADARVVTQDCVVLPPTNPYGTAWNAGLLRSAALKATASGLPAFVADVLLAVADAVEEVQR